VDQVFKIYHELSSGKKTITPVEFAGSVATTHDAIQTHIRKIKKHFDLKIIAQKRPKVIIDPVNGAGCIANIMFLKEIGCDVVAIHDTPQGNFEREPEPTAKNIGDLIRTVKLAKKVDIGFALDVDADRLAIVDELGNALGEDLTLCLAVKAMLSQRRGQQARVVTNLSTTQALKNICDEFGAELILTPIGEINVSKKMIEVGAVVGGEGNGGVIIPSVGLGRDSLTGMAVILKYLCESGQKISHLAKAIPQYQVIKDKVDASNIKDLPAWFKKLEQAFEKSEINRADGVKFTFEDSAWVHVRSSNTEPIVRIIAEARSRDRAQSLINQAHEVSINS
jgi:phosphomannomutase